VKAVKTNRFPFFLIFMFFFTAYSPSIAAGEHPKLIKSIIDYNLDILEKSLVNDFYRGEEGILRIRPEVARSLGMKVYIDQDYLGAVRLFKEADDSLVKAKDAMTSKKKEQSPGYYSRKIIEQFLNYRKNSETAGEQLLAYRSRLNPEVDERLNDMVCGRLLDKLLEESFRKTDNRLRDGLAHFHNICQDEDGNGYPLTPKNVRFVNYVFNEFMARASDEAVNVFDLDRDHGYRAGNPFNWKDAPGDKASRFIPLLEDALQRSGDKIYKIDPLLFIALMRKESSFDPLAVSGVGAAGLTQIMPATAKDMGMKNIHMPEYFDNAISLLKREREKRREAMKALFQISEKNGLQYAKRARQLMQDSLVLRQRRERLFARYRKDLLGGRTDDRLKPAQAIEYGLKYFAKMMKKQKGDISLALACYNAGPHRIREFEGIPPYAETVRFRNWVLKYYRDYLRNAKGTL